MPKRLNRAARITTLVVGLLVIAGSTVGGIALAADRSGSPAPVTPSVSADDHGRAAGDNQDADSDEDGDGRSATPGSTSPTCKADEEADDHAEDSDEHASPSASPSANRDDDATADSDEHGRDCSDD